MMQSDSLLSKTNTRQIIDWRAALISSGVAGTSFLLLTVLVEPFLSGIQPETQLRYLASIFLGSSVLPPPSTFDAMIATVAIVSTLIFSFLYAVLIAIVVYRGNLMIGIILGGALGLALYAINFYSMTLLFPWLFALNNWSVAVSHLLFGAIAGGVYEALEVEKFAPIKSES